MAQPADNSSSQPIEHKQNSENDNDVQLTTLKEIFNQCDLDGNGRISPNELCCVFKSIGKKLTLEEATLMIRRVDLDKNGSVEYEEFFKMMQDYGLRSASDEDSELVETFKIFDKNGDDFIDSDEIQLTMASLGIELSQAEVNAMIKAADVDQNGKIDIAEFKTLLSNIRNKS